MNANKRISELGKRKGALLLSAFICVHLSLISSCASKPTDLRTLVPADTLVYLETNDLGTALRPSMQGKDTSSLNGVQLAIAVMGVDASEEKLNADQSNAQIKPKFVAVADTHTWHFYAVRFAEEHLGAFVEQTYGGKPTIEEPEHPGGGRDIIWTAADGRKAYAFVLGSIVYFSNDRESLDKALAIRTGTASLASTGKLQQAQADVVASGYASKQGVSQIADVIGVKTGASADDPQVQSAIVTILPQLIREMVTDVTWSEKRSANTVTDTYHVQMPDTMTSVLKDTQPADLNDRLRNTVIALLADSKLDDKRRSEVADRIVGSLKADDGTETHFTPTGLERTSTSTSGLLGTIVSQLQVATP